MGKRPFSNLVNDKETCKKIGKLFESTYAHAEKQETHDGYEIRIEMGIPFNYFRIVINKKGQIFPFSNNPSHRQILPTWDIVKVLQSCGYDPNATEPAPPCACGGKLKIGMYVSVMQKQLKNNDTGVRIQSEIDGKKIKSISHAPTNCVCSFANNKHVGAGWFMDLKTDSKRENTSF